MNPISQKPKRGQRFVAIHGDGSGAELYRMATSQTVKDTEGVVIEYDDLVDLGFDYWIDLPDIKLWYEVDHA